MSVLSYFNLCVSQGVAPEAKPFTSRELSWAHNGFSETENLEVIRYQLSMLVANGAISRLEIYTYERANELICFGPGMSNASQHQDANSDIDGSEMAILRSQFRSKLQNPDSAAGLHNK
ncbi:hypothetical protein N7513_012431 [Penicillium frequentans]|nr:hypothetical protein N7513_012431 [Penicillium glabrum]